MGKMVLAGNGKLMDEKGISYTECDSIGTVVYVAEDGRFLGSIVIADGIKDGVKDAIQRLKRAGVSKTVMLTGDRRNVAEAVAKEIGLDEVHNESVLHSYGSEGNVSYSCTPPPTHPYMPASSLS